MNITTDKTFTPKSLREHFSHNDQLKFRSFTLKGVNSCFDAGLKDADRRNDTTIDLFNTILFPIGKCVEPLNHDHLFFSIDTQKNNRLKITITFLTDLNSLTIKVYPGLLDRTFLQFRNVLKDIRTFCLAPKQTLTLTEIKMRDIREMMKDKTREKFRQWFKERSITVTWDPSASLKLQNFFDKSVKDPEKLGTLSMQGKNLTFSIISTKPSQKENTEMKENEFFLIT